MIALMDAHARDLDALACRLALSEGVGSTLVLGLPPEDVLLAVAAGSSELSLCGQDSATREAAAAIEESSPLAVTAGNLEDLAPVNGNLLVWELGAQDPVGELERALARVAAGGRVVICVESRRGRDHLLRNLARSSCGNALDVGSCAGRLLLEGTRSGRADAAADELAGLLPLSVVLATPGRVPGLEPLLCDLLLRQHLPPAELFLMDGGGGSVPDDLFGLAARSATRCVLVSRPEESLGATLDEALGGVAAPFLSLLTPGVRLAPQHLAWLGLALERNPEWMAVVSDGVEADGCTRRAGIVRPAQREDLEGAAGIPPLPAQVVFPTVVLRALDGLGPRSGDASWNDLWRQVARAGPIGRVPVPLVALGT